MKLMKCPHCGQKARAHDSERLGRLVQAARYACSNLECGHTFMVETEVLYTLSPSAVPDESLTLPIWSHRSQPCPTTRPACAIAHGRQPEQLQLPEV